MAWIRSKLQGCEIFRMVDSREEDEEVSKVLFELSSNRRASILFKISQEQLKTQQISNVLNMTMTETFRHLQRLSEAKLIEKQVDGTFSITPLGKLAVVYLQGFNFALKNSEYFLEHDATSLPLEFVNRIAELSSGELGFEVLPNLNRFTKIVNDSEEFLLSITDQLDMNTVKITIQKLKKGLKFKLILQENLLPTAEPVPGVEQNFERRVLAKTDVALIMNEKEAFVTLRCADGKMDFAGFFGSNDVFRSFRK